MQKYGIEPGLMRVFRFYAWLRFSVFLVTTLPAILIFGMAGYTLNFRWTMIFAGSNMLFLLGYLYLPQLKDTFRKMYIPVGIGLATICLLIEQNLVFSQRGYGQIQPFLYVLLILVAWQYSFGTMIFYTLSTIIIEIGLFIFFPNPMLGLSPERFPDTQSMIVYGSMFARLVSFLIIGFAVHHLVEAQRQQRRALAEANQKLVSHAATLEQLTISHERNRLSRELHDTLAHTLSALAVQLDAVLTTWQDIPEKGKNTLEQMLTTTRNGLNETRRVLRALRASPLEEMGLASAIRTLAEDVAARGNLSLELDIPESVDSLSPDIEQGFYRVAQESFENVIQHAQATRLSVHLEDRKKQITLTIHDDGKGIDHKRMHNEQGLGIKGMMERADIMGATLHIQNPPEGGTSVTLNMERKS